MYTTQVLLSMSKPSIWTTLHLHKGYLGTTPAGDRCYYIGDADLFGIHTVQGAFMAFSCRGESFRTLPWVPRMAAMNQHAPWQGPATDPALGRPREGTSRGFLHDIAAQAKLVLNEALGPTAPRKPKLRKPPRPIAPEDQPDAGTEKECTIYPFGKTNKPFRRPLIRNRST